MKHILLLSVLALALAGCYGTESNGRSKSFAQQIAELEAQPLPADARAQYKTASQNEADRAMDVAAAAQKERRAEAPLVESNYIFGVLPDKGTYAYDEYNQVVTDDPKNEDYTNTKRLWTKPKRSKPEAAAAAEAEAPAAEDGDAAASADDASYE